MLAVVPSLYVGRRSSVVEQRFRKPQVKGSTPFTGSTHYPSCRTGLSSSSAAVPRTRPLPPPAPDRPAPHPARRMPVRHPLHRRPRPPGILPYRQALGQVGRVPQSGLFHLDWQAVNGFTAVHRLSHPTHVPQVTSPPVPWDPPAGDAHGSASLPPTAGCRNSSNRICTGYIRGRRTVPPHSGRGTLWAHRRVTIQASPRGTSP